MRKPLPLLWLVLLIGALKLIGYLAVVAGDAGVALLLAMLWAPLAAVLFWRARQRRALTLAAGLHGQSQWRHRLRGGVWMAMFHAAAALPLAVVLLAVLSQPQAPRFWWWLLFSALLWWLLWSLAQRVLQRDVNPQFLSHAAGVLSVRVTGAAMLLLLLFVSLWTAVADVSAMNLLQAVRLGMREAAGESPLLLTAAKCWHALSWARMWLVQQVVASSPSVLLSLLAWVLLLVQAACFVWPVLLMMQGVTLLHERLAGGVATRLRKASAALPPWAVRATPVAAGALALLLACAVLAPRPLAWMFDEPQQIQLAGTRYAVPEARLHRILQDNAAWLDADLESRIVVLDELVNTEIDRLFADVRARVPAYADWHYSFQGGMTRSVAGLMEYFSASPGAAGMLSERLFPAAAWQQGLQALERTTAEAYLQQLRLLRDDTLVDLQRRLSGWEMHPHWPSRPDTLANFDASRTQLLDSPLRSDLALRQSGASAALGAGAAAFSLTRSVHVATQARAAQAATQGAARVGARVAGRGSAAGGVTLCAASGPLALGCAVAVFTGVTLASEYAILKADELLSRQQLEADLAASIDALAAAVKEAYLADMLAALRQDSDHLRAGIASGLRRPIDTLRAQ